jgi:uncharacterized protein
VINRFITFVVAQRRWVLVVIALLTAACCLQLRQLHVVIDTAKLLPPEHPNVVGTLAAESLFGSRHVVVVGISVAENDIAYSPSLLEAVASLTHSLGDTSGVKRHTLMSASAGRAKAISGTETELKVERMLSLDGAGHVSIAEAAGFRERLAVNPIYQHSLMSEDGKLASVSFSIEAGSKGFRESMDRVNAVVASQMTLHPQLKYAVAGAPALFAEVERLSARMALLFPVALFVIGLIHLEAFRTWQGLVLPLVTALLAVSWGLGMMGALGIEMDAFNATTPILILAVAAGHAVQVLKRYYEEFDRMYFANPNANLAELNRTAVIGSLTKIGPVMITAGGVASIGLFSLATFDIATIRTFGIFTGLGIVSALIIELTFIPALRASLPPSRPKRSTNAAEQNPRVWDRLSDTLCAAVLRHRFAILFVFGVTAAISSLGLFHLNHENSTKSYFSDAVQVRADDALLNRQLAGTNTLYVMFRSTVDDRMKDPRVLSVIEDTQRYLQSLPDVGKTISIVDFIKQMNRSMNAGDEAAYRIPKTAEAVSQYMLLYSLSGEPTDFDSYVDYGYRNANLIVWMKNDTSGYANTLLKNVRAFVEPRLPAGVTLQIGGSAPQTAALSQTLVEGKLKNVTQIIIVVFIAGLLVFRSFLVAVYIIVPLVVTVLVNFGFMGITGIPLNTPNSVASALAIGIGADYSIYLMYRIREEFMRLGDLDAALKQTFRTAGLGVIYVASAIVGGYSVLMLSFNFYIHIWFGILIVLSMVVSAASALALVPALIRIWPPGHLQAPPKKSPLSSAVVGALAFFVSTVVCLTAVIPLEARADTKPKVKQAAPAVGAGIPVAAQGASSRVPAKELSADEIMEKSYQANRVDGSVSEATFRLLNADGHERIRKTFGATKLAADGIRNRRVIRFLSPSDVRNTTTLLVETADDDEVSVYLPVLKKVRRLARNNKKGSFVGTDLSYGDMIGHKPGDWSHRLVQQERLGTVNTYLVESLPKTKSIMEDSGYGKRLSWIAADSFALLKAEFLDSALAPLKTAVYADIKLVDAKTSKYQAMRIEVKNAQTGHRTFISFDRFDADSAVGEEYFSTRYLEKEQ